MTIGATTRFGLTTWSSGDDAFGRAQFQQANLSIDNLAAIFRSGATGATPDPTQAAHQKTFWYDTTTSVLYYNDGSAWRPVDDKAVSGDAYTVVAGTVASPQGASARIARADHKHPVSTAAASTISGSNSEGTSASLARADHNHNIAAGTVSASMLAGNIGRALLATDVVKATGGLSFDTTNGLSVNTGATIELSSNALIVKTNTIGPTHLTTAVAGNGLAGGNGTALSVNVDGSTVEINADAIRVKDTGVGKAKLNSDVVKTNGGLSFLNADGLSVNTDGTTVELSSGSLRVKDTGVGKAKLNSDVVKSLGGLSFNNTDGLSVNTSTTVGLSSGNLIVNTNTIGPTHLTEAVAGNGLAGGNGTALSVNTDGTTLEISSDSLRVKDSGVGKAKLNSDVVKANGGLVFAALDGLSVNTDGTTVELSAGGAVRVKDAGVGKAKLNTDIYKAASGIGFNNTDGLSVLTSATIGYGALGAVIVNTNSLDSTHLKTTTVGNGLTGGNGTALAVVADPNGVATGVASISVGASGVKVNGGIVFTSAGTPSASYPDGNMSVDTTNHLLYYRSGSSWRNALWAAGTANSAPSAKGVWVSNGTAPTTQGSVGDIWITY